MAKFKVGDVVERTGRSSGVWRAFTAQETGPYTVTSTTPGGWIQLNGYESVHEGLGKHPFDDDNFTLVEQDDPLPPAPKSALYINEWGWGIEASNLGDEVRIGTGQPGSNFGWCYANMDPDTAFQLAHDLNRMANEIKRRERAQSGE